MNTEILDYIKITINKCTDDMSRELAWNFKKTRQ